MTIQLSLFGTIVPVFIMIEDQSSILSAIGLSSDDLAHAEVFVKNFDPREPEPSEITVFSVNLGRGWQAPVVPAILPIMVSNTSISQYSALEETLNVSSHALGFALSIIALVALLLHSMSDGDILTIVSVTIFGCSLIITYAASTIYHSSRSPLRRSRLRIMDHASIYLLIAGTYTPFSLIVLQGSIGWIIFGISWVMAIVGITLKIFFTGRYRLLSTLMYLFMGWLIVFAIVPLIEKMPVMGMRWLVAGGLVYTLGAIFYAIRKIPLNHAIFHIFTMVGSICHFVAVYLYVI